MKDLRVVFMGTPDFACKILNKLIKLTNVVLVVSQPDKPVGRKKVLTPSPVKQLALDNNIKVYTPNKIREEYQEVIDMKPDMIITCAYGQLIPKILLDYPKYKCINVHASALPYLRGGAPIHHSIIDGYNETGITIMYMDEGMDSGDIIEISKLPILDTDNLDALSEKLSNLGAELLATLLPKIITGDITRTPQDASKVTFAPIIKKEDELINFNRPVREVFNQIRGLSSNPGAYFTLNNEVVKVYASRIGDKSNKTNQITNIYRDGFGIGCSDGEIIITELKPSGKNRISARDYLNGIKKEELMKGIINNEVSK